MLETMLGPMREGEIPEDEVERMLDEGSAICGEDLSELGKPELNQLAITETQRLALLRGETVVAGAICICMECQDSMFTTNP